MRNALVVILGLMLLVAPAISVAGQQPDEPSDSGDSPPEDGDQDPGERGNQTNDTQEPPEGENETDRSEDARHDPQPIQDGNYSVGSVAFTLEGATLRNVTVNAEPLLAALTVPGLQPGEVREQEDVLSLRGDDAHVRIMSEGGMLLRADTDDTVTGTLAEGVDARFEDGQAILEAGSFYGVLLSSDELVLDGDAFTAEDDLRLMMNTSDRPQNPIWNRDDRGPRPTTAATALPYKFDGRFLSFTLNATGIANLTVHGTPIGSIGFNASQVEEFRRSGSQLDAEGETFELKAIDAPAARLTLEADTFTADLPSETTLPSDARIEVRIEDDELRLEVQRPAGALSDKPSVEHRPAAGPLEHTPGPNPGLKALSSDGELGVKSTTPQQVAASFEGRLDGAQGNVSLNMSLDRALLIDDANGNNRVDIGEPALARTQLVNGTTRIQGDELVSTFALWSGTLSVRVEPGDATAKVTYDVENLSAPPGTLFVLESSIDAPPSAELIPTDTGVEVTNGSMQAAYSTTGPVTVDGEEGWADRSIFVDSNDTVRILLAYPAGDNITHDPTLSVQSIPGAAAVSQIAASPYAIGAGAVLAGLLVGVTAYRRQRGPR